MILTNSQALLVYARLAFYLILVNVFVLRSVWFPHFRFSSVCLALYFGCAGVITFLDALGMLTTESYLRLFGLLPLQILLVVVALNEMWRSHKWVNGKR